ncbi:MAG TPA: FGGY-family carbohydrate kinase [Spirochaetia bacterium]|nr:FGGY-family carbohydrate kinase [Spirochaetia bacterium]
MSLLGIDVGTTGCKSVLFDETGAILASAYEEYDIKRREPGYMELDSRQVWQAVKTTVGKAVSVERRDPVSALSVTSMGEAVVPVSADRRILGDSILLPDSRGGEFVRALHEVISDEECYRISGNPVNMQYGLPKLMWVKANLPDLYRDTYKFLNWGSFVTYMLGAEPSVDYCLANRNLLFDIRKEAWSTKLLSVSGIDRTKIPDCVAPGTPLGRISAEAASELGLPANIELVAGAHDQCANALGCGVVAGGQAMYGMGTFSTIVPVFSQLPDSKMMLEFGLNTEHHAVGGLYVSFLYHMGGATVKWFRDTFASAETEAAANEGRDIYEKLFAEIPPNAGPLLVQPYFSPMGPPDYRADSAGVIVGLTCGTTRGDILKSILEANSFALKVSVDNLGSAGVDLESFTAVGGGSRSDAAVQLFSDLFNRPFVRPNVTEAGALGAAILAGVATGVYASAEAAVAATVRIERVFEPEPVTAARYEELYGKYLQLCALMDRFTKDWVSFQSKS